MNNNLINKISREIRSSIEKNQIEKGLSTLKNLVITIGNVHYVDQVIILNSNFQKLKSNEVFGLKVKEPERNKILVGILNILNELEKLNPNFSVSTSSYTPSSELTCYIEEFVKASKASFKLAENEHEELYSMKIKLYELLFSEIDEKIISVNENRQQHVKILFERILFSNGQNNRLSQVDYNSILLIRESPEFNFYHRSLIVSSLTISSLNEEVLNLKKLNILIDFLTDFELEVWEKALVGIILNLYKWDVKLKFKKYQKIVNRLSKLKGIPEVQESLDLISYELRHYRYNMKYSDSVTEELNKNLTNRTYPFWEKPYNWFLPFFRENPIIESILLTTKHKIKGLEHLQDLLTHSYLSNAEKYSFCLELDSYEEGRLKKYINNLEEHNKKCNYNHTFQIILTDIFQFYNYFPKLDFFNLLKRQIKVHESNFLGFLANEKHENLIRAEGFYSLDNYEQALVSYEKLMKITPNNYDIKRRTAFLLMELDFNEKALSKLRSIRGMKIKDWDRMMKGICLARLGKFKKAIREYLRIKDLDSIEDWHFKMGHCYFELDNFAEALKYFNLQLEKAPHLASYCRGGTSLEELERYEEAIEYHSKALELDKDHEHSFTAISDCYKEMGNEKVANEWLEKFKDYQENKITANKAKPRISSED